MFRTVADAAAAMAELGAGAGVDVEPEGVGVVDPDGALALADGVAVDEGVAVDDGVAVEEGVAVDDRGAGGGTARGRWGRCRWGPAGGDGGGRRRRSLGGDAGDGADGGVGPVDGSGQAQGEEAAHASRGCQRRDADHLQARTILVTQHAHDDSGNEGRKKRTSHPRPWRSIAELLANNPSPHSCVQ